MYQNKNIKTLHYIKCYYMHICS